MYRKRRKGIKKKSKAEHKRKNKEMVQGGLHERYFGATGRRLFDSSRIRSLPMRLHSGVTGGSSVVLGYRLIFVRDRVDNFSFLCNLVEHRLPARVCYLEMYTGLLLALNLEQAAKILTDFHQLVRSLHRPRLVKGIARSGHAIRQLVVQTEVEPLRLR